MFKVALQTKRLLAMFDFFKENFDMPHLKFLLKL